MGLLWMCCSVGYFGISLGVADLGDDILITAALSAIVEAPCSPLAKWMVGSKRLGRRWSLFWTMVVTVTACVLASTLSGSARTMLAMVGKFSVAAAFAIVYLYGSELFPASVRSLAMGIQSTMARVGALFAPELLGMPAPMLIFGLIAGISVPGILLLPETLGRQATTTLEEDRGRDVL